MGFINTQDVRRETRVLAGKSIPVAVTSRHRSRGKIAPGLISLLKGMRLTFGYLIRPSKIVTRQYPENRKTLKFTERFRAILRLVYDEHGYHHCTACRLCEKACPNASIKIMTRKGPVTDKLELDRYVWRQDSCVFCNACLQACPFGALQMGHEFESAVYDRRLLVSCLNRYAGPAASVLLKQEDAEVRKKMMELRDRYGGPVPLNGHGLPNVRPLPVTPRANQSAAEPAASAGGQP
jgi:formate hydrogenlyase subunit 6/NADH:ubiquinone oxidoreductase subunit I